MSIDVLTLGYLLLYCGNSLCLNLLGTTLLELQQQVNSTISSITLVFAAQNIGVALGSAIGGPLYDRPKYKESKSAHLLLSFFLFCVIIFTIMTPLFNSLYILIIIALFQGTTIGFARMGANFLILRHHGDNAAPFMQSLHFLGGVGAWIAPMLVRYFVEDKNMMIYVYSLSAMSLVPIVIWMTMHGLMSDDNNTVKYVPLKNNVDDNTKSLEEESESLSSFPFYMILLGVAMFLLNGSRFVLQSYLVPYGLQCKNLNISHADSLLLSATYSGAFAIGRLLGIGFSVYIKAGNLLFIDMSGTVIAASIMLFWPETSYHLLLICSGLFGISMSSVFPTAIVYANQLASNKSGGGLRLSILMISASIGSIILSKYVGYGFDNGHEGINQMNWTNFWSCTISVLLMIMLKSIESTHQKKA